MRKPPPYRRSLLSRCPRLHHRSTTARLHSPAPPPRKTPPWTTSRCLRALRASFTPSSAYAASVMSRHPSPQSGHSPITALRRCRSSSLLLGEGLAQLVLLLLWEVGRDDLEVIGPELVDHPLGRRRPL